MKRLLLAGLVAASCTTATHADSFGFEISAYSWQQNFSGHFRGGENGVPGDKIDVEKDLGYKDETSNNFYAWLEHPIPILPNIRLAQSDIDLDANGALTGQEFKGVTYNGDVKSTLNLSSTDVTLYYQVLDNWVHLDIGLTGRVIKDGKVSITGTNPVTPTGSFEADGVLPLLYGAVRFEIPLGFYVGGDLNGIGVGDDSIIDYRINAGWESSIGLGVEGGYRAYEFDYDDDEDVADLSIDGAYLGVFYHF